MKTSKLSRYRRRTESARRQQGVVLLIALIVLVSMTLAAIGMTRSIDTANVVAGNLGFKQSTLNAADQGIDAAYAWLLANAGTTTLNNTDTATGYFSSTTTGQVDWVDPSTWTNAVDINAGAEDAAGNVVSYVIHRMCTEADTPYNGTGASGNPNLCALTMPSGAAATGGSMSVGAVVFAGTPQSYYRITARSRGPRNTESYVQSIVAITN